MNYETLIQTLITLAAVWYAWETRKLWKEAVKNNELSLRPFVIISYTESERNFKLTNLGNTPALNVKIDDVTLIDVASLKFDYIFPEIDVIPQQSKK